jgi:5-methylcytosine-specific restriction endonuclease McrA
LYYNNGDKCYILSVNHSEGFGQEMSQIDSIINKHKKKERYEIPYFDVYIIESYEWDVKIIAEFNSNFENDFNDDKHYKFLINEWNYNIMENSYDLYSELYDYLKLHLTILQEEQLKKEQLEKIKKEKIQEEQLKKDKLEKIKKEKIKKKTIPKPLKQKIWNNWIGIEIGQTKCLCCKLNDISQGSFSCGHIIAEINGGELKMDNLKPICVSCNSSMGTRNMNEFIIKYGF